jgi:hypothetical protein
MTRFCSLMRSVSADRRSSSSGGGGVLMVDMQKFFVGERLVDFCAQPVRREGFRGARAPRHTE